MKIVKSETLKLVHFKDLSEGDCFTTRMSEVVYMKATPTSFSNSLKLSSGELSQFCSDTACYKVDSKLEWKYE